MRCYYFGLHCTQKASFSALVRNIASLSTSAPRLQATTNGQQPHLIILWQRHYLQGFYEMMAAKLLAAADKSDDWLKLPKATFAQTCLRSSLFQLHQIRVAIMAMQDREQGV